MHCTALLCVQYNVTFCGLFSGCYAKEANNNYDYIILDNLYISIIIQHPASSLL
jgi:hypothetical protein